METVFMCCYASVMVEFMISCIKATFLPSDTLHCFSSVAQWLACRPMISWFAVEVEFHLHVEKDQKLCLTSLLHSRLVNLSLLVNYLSFLAVIVSIDTTLHLTPTGLHNLVFLPGTHKSTHIQRHWHTPTRPHSLPSHFLSEFALGELEVSAYFMGKPLS